MTTKSGINLSLLSRDTPLVLLLIVLMKPYTTYYVEVTQTAFQACSNVGGSCNSLGREGYSISVIIWIDRSLWVIITQDTTRLEHQQCTSWPCQIYVLPFLGYDNPFHYHLFRQQAWLQ